MAERAAAAEGEKQRLEGQLAEQMSEAQRLQEQLGEQAAEAERLQQEVAEGRGSYATEMERLEGEAAERQGEMQRLQVLVAELQAQCEGRSSEQAPLVGQPHFDTKEGVGIGWVFGRQMAAPFRLGNSFILQVVGLGDRVGWQCGKCQVFERLCGTPRTPYAC
jgi:hypothetical protein